MLLALAVAVLHAAVVVLLLTGGLLALRSRRVVPWHAAAALGVGVVHVAGADCPLTTWERSLRERAGAGYDGGFLDHYLLVPLGLDGSPAVPPLAYALVLLPNALGYGLLLSRRRRPLPVRRAADLRPRLRDTC